VTCLQETPRAKGRRLLETRQRVRAHRRRPPLLMPSSAFVPSPPSDRLPSLAYEPGRCTRSTFVVQQQERAFVSQKTANRSQERRGAERAELHRVREGGAPRRRPPRRRAAPAACHRMSKKQQLPQLARWSRIAKQTPVITATEVGASSTRAEPRQTQSEARAASPALQLSVFAAARAEAPCRTRSVLPGRGAPRAWTASESLDRGLDSRAGSRSKLT
jgi:hypothetical protein